MAADTGGTIAAHYIYLLKDDEALPQLWSAITAGAELAPSEPFSLGLAPGHGRHHGHGCSIVSRSGDDGREVCLGMLAELAVIELRYRGREETTPQSQWRGVLESIEADRGRAGTDEATILGETTLLVAGELGDDELISAAAGVFPDSNLLITDIDPSVGGGSRPLWAYVLERRKGQRDFFVLAASTPDTLVESLLPEVDSVLKKLGKTAKYFAHQRQTIVKERLQVDKEVSAILHERVVAGGDTYDPDRLERDIAVLSRMFGVLATDSQLVRRAAEQIEKDRHRLDFALSPVRASGGARDEATEYFTTRYDSELASARAEGVNLDFSRGNAQAAIEVVRTQVDLLRAGEEAALQAQTKEILDRSLLLQEERLALQVAAGFIEFVLVFYYTLKSWEGVVGHGIFDHVPSLLRLLVVAGVAAGATIGTHSLAAAIRQKKANGGVWLAAALIVMSLAGLVTLSVMNT
ncbi:MAG: hypothetical protein C4534_04075 [Gaiellales bacterium]|nr:MAG: hypothetical protein C4534_04075 [Gaiellales bacterium]